MNSGDIKYPDKLAQDLSKDAKQVREGIKDLRPQIQSGHVNAWQYDALIDKTSQDLKLSQDQHDAVRAKVEHDRKVEGWKDLGMGAIALGASLTLWGAGRTIAWGATRATGWALGSFMSAKEIGRYFEDRSFANVNMGYNRTNDVFKSQGAPSELGVALAAASFVPGVGSGVSSALRGLKQSGKLGAMTQATGQALNRAAQEGELLAADAAARGVNKMYPNNGQGVNTKWVYNVGKDFIEQARKVKLSNPDFKNMTNAEFIALRAYTGKYYKKMNARLRGATSNKYVKWDDAINSAQNGLKNLGTQPGRTYNGISWRGMQMDDKKVQELFKAGEIFKDKAFLSSSTNYPFRGNVQIQIRGKSSTSIDDLSIYLGEKEVLFLPNTEFKVLSVTQEKNGNWKILMAEQ